MDDVERNIADLEVHRTMARHILRELYNNIVEMMRLANSPDAPPNYRHQTNMHLDQWYKHVDQYLTLSQHRGSDGTRGCVL